MGFLLSCRFVALVAFFISVDEEEDDNKEELLDDDDCGGIGPPDDLTDGPLAGDGCLGRVNQYSTAAASVESRSGSSLLSEKKRPVLLVLLTLFFPSCNRRSFS